MPYDRLISSSSSARTRQITLTRVTRRTGSFPSRLCNAEIVRAERAVRRNRSERTSHRDRRQKMYLAVRSREVDSQPRQHDCGQLPSPSCCTLQLVRIACDWSERYAGWPWPTAICGRAGCLRPFVNASFFMLAALLIAPGAVTRVLPVRVKRVFAKFYAGQAAVTCVPSLSSSYPSERVPFTVSRPSETLD